MAWRTISVALEAKTDSFNAPLDRAGAKVDAFGRKADTAAAKWERWGDRGKKALFGFGVGLGVAGVAAAKWGLGIAAANEQAEISFTTMLGSAKKAHAFVAELKQFAAVTPFEFADLQQAASSLISAGIDADKVIPIMRTLGDTTAGMDTGAEGIQRATIALQQMNAAGRITGEDLNQLRDAGIPVYDLLAAATGRSKAEVVQLAQAGKLGARELGQLMRALETGKGLERFSGLMDKQSRTLNGLISTAKDVLGQGLATLFEPVIGVAERTLPAALAKMQDFMNIAQSAGAELQPIGTALVDLYHQVEKPAREVGEHLIPVLQDLVHISIDNWVFGFELLGAAMVGVLKVAVPLADGLHVVTSFLARNDEVVKTALVAWAAYTVATEVAAGMSLTFAAAESTSTIALLANKVASAGATAYLVALYTAEGIATIATNGLTTSFLALAGAEVGAGVAMGGAAAGIAAGAFIAQNALDRWHGKGKKQADELAESITRAGDTSTIGGYAATTQALQNQAEALWQAGREAKSYGEQQTKWAKAQELDEQAAAYERLTRSIALGAIKFRKETGLTAREVVELARRSGKSLDEAFATKKGRQDLKAFLEQAKDEAKILGLTVNKALTVDPDVLKANAEKIKAAMSAAAQSFNGFSDLLKLKDEPVDPKALKAAEKRVQQARDRVLEAEREARAQGQTADEAQRTTKALGDARAELSGAQQDLRDLQATDSPLNKAKIEDFYRSSIATAKTFTANVQKAIAAGYDPNLVSRIIQAGPEQAGPILEQLVRNATGAFVIEVNNAESALAALSQFAVEQARLTARAMASTTTGAVAADLPAAQRIAQVLFGDNKPLTLEDLAKRAKLSVEDLRRVVKEYDIDLGKLPTEIKLHAILEGVAAVEARLDAATKDRTVRIKSIIDQGASPGIVNAERRANRWGGVTHYAAGGTRQAMLGHGRGIVWWDEPSTGGEAYVPRFGDPARSTSVLREAAKWYGGQFVTRDEMRRATTPWLSTMPAPRQQVTMAPQWAQPGRASGGRVVDNSRKVGDLYFVNEPGDPRAAARDMVFELGRL